MVITESWPSSRARARRNSNLRTLLPDKSLEVRSSLLIHRSTPSSVKADENEAGAGDRAEEARTRNRESMDGCGQRSKSEACLRDDLRAQRG